MSKQIGEVILNPIVKTIAEIMELANNLYPMRALIRYKAKEQLKFNLEKQNIYLPLDESLFAEVATILFRAGRHPQLQSQCASRTEAAAIEDQFAAELAETYKQIKLRQKNIVVQRLNALL